MQEHQTIPTNATVSKDSDTISISVIMAVYEIFFFIFQVNLRNQEIVYQHNITDKLSDVGIFPVYLRMALIFTDFQTGSGSQPCALLEICEYQNHP